MSQPALLVIDYINELADPKGKLAAGVPFLQQHDVIARVNQAIDHARSAGWLLLFVKVGFSPDYVECPKNSPIFSKAEKLGVLVLDTWATAFIDALHYQEGDTVIVKHRVSPFYGTDLDLCLRANQIDHLYLAGFSTDMAVQCTAREGHDRDYTITILTDACGAHTQENHQMALQLCSRVASLQTVEDLLGAI
jgi:nicotinamidase-related amidase